MINTVVCIFFINASLIPVLGGALFLAIPSGSPWTFRILLICFLACANYFFIKFLGKTSRKRETNNPSMRAAAALLLLLGSLFFFYRAYADPYGGWDAWAIHNAKARGYAFSFLEGMPFRLYWSVWEGNPSLFSLQLAVLSVLLGSWTTALPIIVAYLYYTFIFLAIYDHASNCDPEQKKLSYLFLFLSALFPPLLEQASNQYADAPLSFFYLMCFKAYFDFRDSQNSKETGGGGLAFYSLIALVSVTIMPMIKNEGSLLALPLLTFAALYFLKRKYYKALLLLALFSAGPVAFLLYIKNVSSISGVHISFDYELITLYMQTPARYKVLVKYLLTYHFLNGGGILFYALYIARKQSLILLSFLISFAMYHIVFLLVNKDMVWQLQVAYFRITLHFYPALFAAALYSMRYNSEKRQIHESTADKQMATSSG